MKKTTAVSYEGDKPEIKALGQLADEMGISIGRLVADAVRKAHGAELDKITPFFRKRDLSKSHTTSEKVDEADHA